MTKISFSFLALGQALKRIADVTIVAPEREQSTMGHALTLHKPVRLYKTSSPFFRAVFVL
jgi:5'-nucleotidase